MSFMVMPPAVCKVFIQGIFTTQFAVLFSVLQQQVSLQVITIVRIPAGSVQIPESNKMVCCSKGVHSKLSWMDVCH